MRPSNHKYTETHEWVSVKGEKKEATVGITDFAVSQLSDLVHVELPKVGDKAEQGSSFGEIESVKTVADLVSPVTGKITAVNTDLVDDLDRLSKDPFGDGWLLRIQLDDPKETASLMSVKDYEEFLTSSQEDEEVDDDDFD